MGTLSARNLRESLQKAKNVGIVEERFQLFNECEVVVRNLRPDEYTEIDAECKDLEGIDYLYKFQEGHVKRAVIELNGQDLRDVQFVEDEEEDPKKPDQMRAIKLELADWLVKNVLKTWGKEAVYIAYRKCEDAVDRAEKKAKDGVVFITPEETDEDRFRRLAGEIKDLEANLPEKLIDNVLDDHGYMRKATADDIKRGMEKADQIAREAAAKNGGNGPATPPAAAAPPAAPQAPPAPPAAAAQAPQAPVPTPQSLMQGRQPMNQVAVDDVPQPVIVSPSPGRQAPIPAVRQPRPGVSSPDQVHPPIQTIAGPPIQGSAAVRAARTAALEADADLAGAISPTGGQLPPKPAQVPIIERRLERADPKAAQTVMDPKPVGGVNPHYRGHNRGV
jgi:hypothetical protein